MSLFSRGYKVKCGPKSILYTSHVVLGIANLNLTPLRVRPLTQASEVHTLEQDSNCLLLSNLVWFRAFTENKERQASFFSCKGIMFFHTIFATGSQYFQARSRSGVKGIVMWVLRFPSESFGEGLDPWSLTSLGEPSRKKRLWLGWADLISDGVNLEVNVYSLDVFFSPCVHVSIPELRVVL